MSFIDLNLNAFWIESKKDLDFWVEAWGWALEQLYGHPVEPIEE